MTILVPLAQRKSLRFNFGLVIMAILALAALSRPIASNSSNSSVTSSGSNALGCSQSRRQLYRKRRTLGSAFMNSVRLDPSGL